MNAFPWILGTFAIIGLIMSMILMGFGWGKEDLRGQYHQCIELGAPQQNCIDKFLGKGK